MKIMASSFLRKSLLSLGVVGLGAATSITYNLLNGNHEFYSNFAMPILRNVLDGEQAHEFAIKMAKLNLIPKMKPLDGQDQDLLSLNVFNRRFKSPIGLAAGFDKNGEAIKSLFDIGFGFVEIGTITPKSQAGNPRPRVFRLDEDRAVINRYGFNSDGHDRVLERVRSFRAAERNEQRIVGINIGKNKESTDPVRDYLMGVEKFADCADYIVINISSPNTPGLRNLQSKSELEKLIDPIIELRNRLNEKLPVLVKIAPDLNDDELKDIAAVLTRKHKRVDGVIVSNTTISRPENLLSSANRNESGGLSGRPLKEKSTQVLKRMSELVKGSNLVMIGVGGIESGRDALEKIKAGASLVQIYTAMTYDGPTLIAKISQELIDLLKKEGYSNVSQAIGVDLKSK